MEHRRQALFVLGVLVPGVAGIASACRPQAPRPASVVIAEVMTSNAATIVDEDGDATDWIELWNRSDEAIDLAGWSLTEGDNDPWGFSPLTIDPDQRIVIFASGKSRQHRLHTDFQLSADGEHLRLRDAQGRTADEYRTPGLGADVSYGRGSNDKIGILSTATPGAANSTTKPAAAAKPVLSRPGGYIDGAVSVTAETATDGAELWFTTDGSAPTDGHGTRYTTPITVDRSTTLRIVATHEEMSDSFVASATYLVMGEVLAQTGTPIGWSTAPVNGQVYQYGFDQQYVAEHREEVASALRAAPTLSVTTDLGNLINKTTGIYSNPAESGAAWERPASIELIDADSGFQINGGLRLKGGYFRNVVNPKHSFRLTFAPGYEDLLTYPLFGPTGVQTFASVDLRTEQNYGWQPFPEGSGAQVRNTLMRDRFARESQAAVGDPATRSRWVHLFLNGQYWGVYMLRDDVTAAHATQLWGGTEDEYDVIGHSDDFGYEVDGGDDREWLQLWEAISDGEVTDDEFSMITGTADLIDLADLMIINACLGNLDSYPSWFLQNLRANNWQAVRGNGQPFRFFVDDAEHTLGAWDHDVAIDRGAPSPIVDGNEQWTAHNFNPGWLHQVLLTRPEYRALVRQRATTLLAPDGALAEAASHARWRTLRDLVSPLIDAEAARWGYAGTQELGRPEWEAEVDWVRDVWLPRRTQVFRRQLIADQLLEP